MTTARPVDNPLSRAAEALPVKTAEYVSGAARVLAAVVALVVAIEQTYNPTEVFAPVVAGLLLLTILPVEGRAGLWIQGAGASLAFFAGAVLFNVFVGWLMVPLGVLAMAAVLVQAHHRGTNLVHTALTLLSGPPLVGILIAAVVLTVDG